MSLLRNGRSWRWLLAALALASLMLLLAAACGGEEEAGPAAEKSPTSAAQRSPTPAGQTPSPTTTAAGGTSAAGLTKELEDLAKKWAGKSAKVAYDISTTSGSTTQKMSMTLYWRLPDYRIDLDMGTQGSTTFIVAGGTTYTCVGSGGQGQCQSQAASASDLSSFPFLSEFASPEGFDEAIADMITGLDVKRSTADIAGEKATCYSASGSIQGQQGKIEWCFASDGLLLRLDNSATGSEFVLKATKVERKVSDSDFKPPYPTSR